MIKHSYYGMYKTAIYYLMTIFQQTLIRSDQRSKSQSSPEQNPDPNFDRNYL